MDVTTIFDLLDRSSALAARTRSGRDNKNDVDYDMNWDEII